MGIVYQNTGQAFNFIKKEALAHLFSCEFCEISKSNIFTEYLWATASILPALLTLSKYLALPGNCYLFANIP